MPSKKKGRASGRSAAAPEPTPALEPHHASSSSSSAAHLLAALPTGLASSALSEASSLKAGGGLESLLGGGCGNSLLSSGVSHSHQASVSSADCAAFCSDPNDEDNFEDALEELADGDGEMQPETPRELADGDGEMQPETPRDPTAALLAKDPTLQVPLPSRADWNVEMQALDKLRQDSDVSDLEKCQVFHEALMQRIEDLRKLEEHRTATDRCMEELVKDRDRCKKETQAALAAKGKLKDSCREFQNKKKSISLENKKIIDDEQARQGELNDKFQAAMKDVEEKMSAESEIREHFTKENDELRTKLNKFTESYEEQERQLAEQCAVREGEMAAAQDRLREYETKSTESKANAASLEKKNKALQKTTTALRTELQSILGKFDAFHDSVSTSSHNHGECKSEIDVLSSRLKELEDENTELKSSAATNEQAKEKEKESLKKQCSTLQKLCSNLQKEIDTLESSASASSTGKKGGG